MPILVTDVDHTLDLGHVLSGEECRGRYESHLAVACRRALLAEEAAADLAARVEEARDVMLGLAQELRSYAGDKTQTKASLIEKLRCASIDLQDITKTFLGGT